MQFKCESCDANYIGYTCRHLHQRVEEYKHSFIGEQFLEKHNLKRMNLNTNFNPIQTGLFWSICDWRRGGAPMTPPLYLWNQ